MPLPKTSHENLVHFNCSYCEKWWSIGDAPERDHWFCPWCGKRLEETKSNNDLLVGFWEPGKGLVQAVQFDSETSRWTPIGEIFEANGRDFTIFCPGPGQLPRIKWE